MAEGETVIRLVYSDEDIATVRVAAGIVGKAVKHFAQEAVLAEANRIVTEFTNRPTNRGADS